MIIFILSFVAGVLTVLAPCTLPLLPIIVGGSVSGEFSKKKAAIVSISLGFSILVFTLLLKVSTLFAPIPENFWSYLSGSIIVIFGLITLFPGIWDKLSFLSKINRDSNKMLAVGFKKESVWGDVIVGASLGPIFSSCSPTYFLILATVLPQSPFMGFIDLLAYAVGLSGALYLIAILGQKILGKLEGIADPKGWFKRILGIIFLLFGIAILTGYDKKLEVLVLNSSFDITKIEHLLLKLEPGKELAIVPDSGEVENVSAPEILVQTKPSDISLEKSALVTKLPTKPSPAEIVKIVSEKSKKYPRVPEITKPAGFINTDGKAITLKDLVGKKVILIDFWTYSCINCERTIPYLVDWYKKYKDQGLEIVSIHTPEFAFEKVLANVAEAVKGFGIKYPVVLDNDYGTWNAFFNNAWPRKYLVDIDGFVVYDHIGEGAYLGTERQIQKALQERAGRIDGDASISTSVSNPEGVVNVSRSELGSPEIYFGSDRNEYLANGKQGTKGVQKMSVPQNIVRNNLYLGGSWDIQSEYSESKGVAEIVFKYKAKNVYMVLSADSEIEIEVLRDEKPVGEFAGIDIDKKTSLGKVKAERLYKIIEGSDYSEHTLRIKIPKAGLKAFTFTFG